MSTEPQATDTHDSTSPNTAPTSTSSSSITTASVLSSLHAYPFTSDPAFLAGLSQILGHPGSPVTASELQQNPDLVLSAKCFYFSRKFQTPTPIEPAAYKTWLASQTSTEDSEVTSTATESATAIPTSSTSQAQQQSQSQSQSQSESTSTSTSIPPPMFSSTTPTAPPTTTQEQPAQPVSTPSQAQTPNEPPPPPYPTSFAAIVELITNNKPIPGIEEIPDTVLEHGSSKQDRAVRRKKPWEKDTVEAEADTNMETETSAKANGEQMVDTIETIVAPATGPVSPDAGRPPIESDTATSTEQSEGLLRLLRPDAVPDSGLIAKE